MSDPLLNDHTVLKRSPVIEGTAVKVNYRLTLSDSGYNVYCEQLFDNGINHSGFLAQGVSIERANCIFERHSLLK